jgi:hypothetical protein
MIRIMGEDGKVDLKWINKPLGTQEIDPETGESTEVEKIQNDVTVGAYDVVLETGPSFTTKREEAKDSMREFIQAAPETAPIMMDLYAKSQDWPLGDEIGERFEAMAPPPIQALLKKQKKEHGEEQPSPEEQQQAQAQAQQQQTQQMAVQLELENKHLANEKLKAETAKIASEAQAAGQPNIDPVTAIKAQAEQQKLMLDARRAELEFASMQSEMAYKEKIAAIQLETALVDLAIKKQGLQIDTASAALDLQGRQQGLVHDAQAHAAGLVQGFEKHSTALEQDAERNRAKVDQMRAKPEAMSAQ